MLRAFRAVRALADMKIHGDEAYNTLKHPTGNWLPGAIPCIFFILASRLKLLLNKKS